MLAIEKELIRREYNQACSKVDNSKYHVCWLEEKIKHSYQVLGAGNYIVKHEPVFKNRSAEFIETAKKAVLLHDIGRFEEVYQNYKFPTQKCDHGVMGSDMLKSMSQYKTPLITLPVKHHGHLTERFYEDEEYQGIHNPVLKKDIETILFLVMDADKIANFQMMKQESEKFRYLFLSSRTAEQIAMPLGDNIFEDFQQGRLVKNSDVNSLSDYFVSLICWIYDLNYKISFDFCARHGLITNLLHLLSEYNKDRDKQQKIEKTVQEFLTRKYQLFKEDEI